MASTKYRYRLFAGPNGSGKSTLFEHLREIESFHAGLYIAADKIEKDFKDSREFNFNPYRVKVDETEFIERCHASRKDI